ncbi:DUF104 domain-containing protein [Candidatus Pacearchaeota archaeon]|nr:DUF104 domain-containing protein [Candidatus Pacearchaeota archaeon]
MEPKEIKVKFVNGHFVPLSRVNLKNGMIIEIEIIPEKDEKLSWRGALKNVNKKSVDLQHEIKDKW